MNSFAGKNEWLKEVFETHSQMLLRYAFKLTGDEDQAREAAQETFLRLLYANRRRVEDRVKRWLFTVCRNIIFDKKKKEKRMYRLKEDEVAGGKDTAPLEVLEKKQSRGVLLELMDSLSENQQEVIRLRFQSDFTYKEIADITGLSISNVGFLMHTGLKALRKGFLEHLAQDAAKAGVQ